MLAQLRGGGGGGFNKINAEPALTKVGVKVKVELGKKYCDKEVEPT